MSKLKEINLKLTKNEYRALLEIIEMVHITFVNQVVFTKKCKVKILIAISVHIQLQGIV